MNERDARMRLVDLRARQIEMESRWCRDGEELRGLLAELDVLYASALEMRREQLLEFIEREAA